MDSFEQELRLAFLGEVTQLLSDAEQAFLVLESNPNDKATLEKIFRIAHNIKGSSKAVGFNQLSAFTHEFESFMIKCNSGSIPILPETISLLLKCNDRIKDHIEGLKVNPEDQLSCGDLISELNSFASRSPSPLAPVAEPAPEPEPSPEQTPDEEALTVAEVLTASDLMTQQPPFGAEERSLPPQALHPPAESTEAAQIIPITRQAAPDPSPQTAPPPVDQPSVHAAPQHTPQHGSQAAAQPTPQIDESIRVSLSRLERLLNFVGELVILQTVLNEQAFSDNPAVLRKTIHQMSKVTKEVQELSMSLRMVPLKPTFQKMQRIVRDTSGSLGKKVHLVLQGEETEVDKTVLEALGDPLVHLVRNAVDHGIESPEERATKGKSESGEIQLRAYHESGKLVIEVRDDGGGMSPDRLRQKAIEKGILKRGQELSDKDALHLIFHPGFSTKAEVTEVSGRGVGMDVVKSNIEQMQGEVLVSTQLGKGSVFKIILPLTLAIIEAMVVKCDQERFVIPLAHVHESIKPGPKDLVYTTGMGEVLLLRGENLPVYRLAHALGKKKSARPGSDQIAIIIRTQGSPFAALVDDVIGQHQVVIKKLGAEIQNLKGFSGSAILGDGKPALILELGDLVAGPSSQTNQPVRRLASA